MSAPRWLHAAAGRNAKALTLSSSRESEAGIERNGTVTPPAPYWADEDRCTAKSQTRPRCGNFAVRDGLCKTHHPALKPPKPWWRK